MTGVQTCALPICMVVDFAVHQPDREDGGIPNPHFHVLCPIRPIEQNGKWGLKQRRVYELDEDGNRIRDQNGEFVFNAVPTTDWGSPETLEHWREAWAEMCNAKFAEKGLDVRILNEQYRNQQHPLPDCQKADRQDNLYRPCPFQPDRQRDDGGQNQAYAS